MSIPTPKAAYEKLSLGLAPALADLGFLPVRGCPYPAWRSPVGEHDKVVFFSLQVDCRATDPFAGGGFRIELESSIQRRPALGINGRALFFQLMTVEELRVLLEQQNRVIDCLPAPPPEQLALYPEGSIRQQYLEYFLHQVTFDAVRCWLRYTSEADLRDWARILARLVQPLTDRAAIHLSPNRRALGKGYLLTAS